MKLLSYKDWFDYTDPDYEQYLEETEEEPLLKEEWLEFEYESYISDYEDYAYDKYRDEQLED